MIFLNKSIIDISCGYNHNIILDINKNAHSFGDNSYGQLGVNNVNETHIQTFILINIIQISTGSFNSLLLNNINQIFSFGSNSNGQLGLNLQMDDSIFISTPTQIFLPSSFNTIKQISCGNYHCLILNGIGLIYSFGKNNVIFY
jgi:E3 ubiquitin-protein ligase HERC4